jgi:hypothetical protein
LVLFGLPGLCFFSGFRRRIGALPLERLRFKCLHIRMRQRSSSTRLA